jgi:hypothetical protein
LVNWISRYFGVGLGDYGGSFGHTVVGADGLDLPSYDGAAERHMSKVMIFKHTALDLGGIAS